MNSRLCALLLEDVQKDVEILQEMLFLEGFDMHFDVVETESDFVSKLKLHNYDIIFADFTLPSFNGEEALMLAKKICPYVPFIFISGTIGEDRAVELLKQGATDYVLKHRMERLAFVTKRALDAVIQLDKFRQKEIELQTNRRLLQNVINNAPDAILIKDINGRYLLVNEAAEKVLGKSGAEIIGKDDTFFFSASEAQMLMDLDKKVLESQASQTFEEVVTLADGNIHIFSTIKSPMFDDFGKPTGLFGIARDITERKTTEEAIRQERILLRTLIDNLPDAIYVKDDKGRKLAANAVDLKIMNCTSEAEIIGKTDLEIFDTEAGERGYTEDMSVLQTGLPLLNHEDCFTDEEGVQHWRLTSKIPLFNEQQKVIGLVGVGRDITERRKSEEQLIIAKEKAEESDRLKTAFLHNISHEIRTPMNAIIGFSRALNDSDLVAEKRQQFTDIIIQSSENLLSIITDIISIATIEVGQEKIIEKEIDINETLMRLYNHFSLNAKKQNISFNLTPFITDKGNRILIDENKFIQILNNLLSNALKFTHHGYVNFGYKIIEESANAPSFLQFFVEDSGIGIPSEMHKEIFERFRQVENTAVRNYGGSGLGLSITKAYVELLGGKIWLNSELGKGSTFYFTIPLKWAKKLPSFEKQLTNNANHDIKPNITVLIAEDEASNFMLLKELLSGLHIHILWAKNGLEAVEICTSNRNIDLVLMDIKMPIMDGFEATKQIRKFMPDIPIIAQTAYTSDVDKDKAIACGCSNFISKPLKREFLVSIIKEQLCNI
jgi:PAS domain S-box-containing protein